MFSRRILIVTCCIVALAVVVAPADEVTKPKPKVEYFWIQPYYTKGVTQERETYASENIDEHWFLHKHPIERTPEAKQKVLLEFEKGAKKCLAYVVDGKYRGWLNMDKSNLEKLDQELGIFSEPSPPRP